MLEELSTTELQPQVLKCSVCVCVCEVQPEVLKVFGVFVFVHVPPQHMYGSQKTALCSWFSPSIVI